MTMDVFTWTNASEEAAELLAAGRLTLAQIADKVGRDQRTLWNWRQHPDFAARVEDRVARYRAEVQRRGIGQVARRVASLDNRWNRMRRVIRERALSPEMQGVPGGTTGLLVRDVKSVGTGESAQLVDVYEVDTGLLKELREHEKQAAQELGQWVDKAQVEQTTKAYVTVGPDDL